MCWASVKFTGCRTRAGRDRQTKLKTLTCGVRLRPGSNVVLQTRRTKLRELGLSDCIWIDQDDLSVCCRRDERPKIVSGSNVDLFMSPTKRIIVVNMFMFRLRSSIFMQSRIHFDGISSTFDATVELNYLNLQFSLSRLKYDAWSGPKWHDRDDVKDVLRGVVMVQWVSLISKPHLVHPHPSQKSGTCWFCHQMPRWRSCPFWISLPVFHCLYRSKLLQIPSLSQLELGREAGKKINKKSWRWAGNKALLLVHSFWCAYQLRSFLCLGPVRSEGLKISFRNRWTQEKIPNSGL